MNPFCQTPFPTQLRLLKKLHHKFCKFAPTELPIPSPHHGGPFRPFFFPCGFSEELREIRWIEDVPCVRSSVGLGFRRSGDLPLLEWGLFLIYPPPPRIGALVDQPPLFFPPFFPTLALPKLCVVRG